MLREIKNAIYCITSYTGNRHFVECDSEDELAAYVAEGECKGYSVTSVTRICTDGSRLAVMENGEKVQCYGYYNDCNGVKWLYVVYKNIVGYASSKYLSK